jgi:hypothetical protein
MMWMGNGRQGGLGKERPEPEHRRLDTVGYEKWVQLGSAAPAAGKNLAAGILEIVALNV